MAKVIRRFKYIVEISGERMKNTWECSDLERLEEFLNDPMVPLSFRAYPRVEATHRIINTLYLDQCKKFIWRDDIYWNDSKCSISIEKVKLKGEEAQYMFIDTQATAHLASQFNNGPELYRNFQVTPEKVIFNDPATIVFWKDGTKTVVKCTDGDVYNPEVGLAMCVCKKLYDKKYHKFFKHYTKDAPTRPLQGNVTGATDVSYYSPVDEVINLIKAVFDDTRGESK